MKTIIYNKEKIKEEEITKRVIRVKALLINSKNELLLGYSHNTYQFIGGHIEDGEDMIEGLKREIIEESGIILDNEKINPFFLRKKYCKDYPMKDDVSCYEYYYYAINTDKLPNLDNVSYTEAEKEGKFELRYIQIDKLESEFEENKKVSEKTAIVQGENIEAIRIYKSYYEE